MAVKRHLKIQRRALWNSRDPERTPACPAPSGTVLSVQRMLTSFSGMLDQYFSDLPEKENALLFLVARYYDKTSARLKTEHARLVEARRASARAIFKEELAKTSFWADLSKDDTWVGGTLVVPFKNPKEGMSYEPAKPVVPVMLESVELRHTTVVYPPAAGFPGSKRIIETCSRPECICNAPRD